MAELLYFTFIVPVLFPVFGAAFMLCVIVADIVAEMISHD